MKDKIGLIIGMLCLVIILLPLTNAAPAFIFKQETNSSIKVNCFDENNYYCNDEVTCNITINNPDGSVLVNNQNMTHNPSYYNYTLTTDQTAYTGEYSAVVFCDGSKDGYSSFNYLITRDGNENKPEYTIAIAIISIMLIIVFLVTGLVMKIPVLKWFFIILSILLSISAISGLIITLKGGSAAGILEAQLGTLIYVLYGTVAAFLIWILWKAGWAMLGKKEESIDEEEEQE